MKGVTWLGRWRGLVTEFGKFGVVGAVNFGLDILIFNLLLFTVLGHQPIVAKAMSTVFSATSSYFMNRHWTWKDRARSGTRRELIIFLIMSAIGLGIAEACLLVSHYAFGFTSKLADNVAANVIGLALGTAWRFFAFRTWVFLRPSEAEDTSSPAVAATATTTV